jgi:putative spermidine/putrescine transport system substrate-binding protein
MITNPRRRVVAGGTTAAAASLACPAILSAQERTLVVGGPAGQAATFNKSIGPLFTKRTGFKLVYDGSNSLANLRKIEAQQSDPLLSVVMIDEPVMITARNRNLIARLDAKALPNLADLAPGSVRSDGLYVNFKAPRSAIAYNTRLVRDSSMRSWADVWQPTYRRRVMIPAMTRTTAVFLLTVAAHLETGLPFARAQYETEAGFRKLASLRPNVALVYDNTPVVASMLDQGEAWLAAGLFTSYIVERQQAGAPIELALPTEGSFALSSSVAIVRNAKHLETAHAFVDLLLSPEVQKIFLDEANDSPANRKVALPPNVVPMDRMFVSDWEFIEKHRAAWIDRYTSLFAG